VPVDDDLRAIVELDLQDAARLPLEIDVIGVRFQRAFEALQRGARQRLEIVLVHGVT